MDGRRVVFRRAGLVIAAAAALMATAGCDDGSTASPSARTPTTVPSGVADVSPASRITDPLPATTATATTTEATQPASSVMNINGHLTTFPAARVRLENDGRNVVALLYSDDPREALKSNYTGNSFYLRMVLDIDDSSKLADATWAYTAPSSGDREREADSPYGIFLGGRKIALQPFDVRVRFKADGETAAAATPTTSPSAPGAMTVLISGKFRILDDTPGRGPAQVLPISAELPVQIDAQR